MNWYNALAGDLHERFQLLIKWGRTPGMRAGKHSEASRKSIETQRKRDALLRGEKKGASKLVARGDKDASETGKA